MHRFAPVLVLVGLFAVPAARSQTVQIYGTVAPTYLNHLYTVTGSTNPSTSTSGYWFVPPNAGLTLNFTKPGPVSVGLDFRGGPKIGTPGLGSFLVGIKVGVKPTVFQLKPYGQFSMGYLDQSHTTGSGLSATTNSQAYFAVEILGGVDYPVAPHIAIRVVEVGVGLTHYGANTGSNTSANPSIFSLQSGVVLNF
jgi:hypothetical protein